MKTMKAFCTAILLTLTISISAFAGEIATQGAARTVDSTGTISNEPLVQPALTEIGGLDTSAFGDLLLTLVSMF